MTLLHNHKSETFRKAQCKYFFSFALIILYPQYYNNPPVCDTLIKANIILFFVLIDANFVQMLLCLLLFCAFIKIYYNIVVIWQIVQIKFL